MTKDLRAYMDSKIASKEEEFARWSKAQEEKDYDTMWMILYRTAVNYTKKRMIAFKLSPQEISDIATDICVEIMGRYERNPNYKATHHMAAVHFCFLKCVYGKRQKEDKQDKLTTSYESWTEERKNK